MGAARWLGPSGALAMASVLQLGCQRVPEPGGASDEGDAAGVETGDERQPADLPPVDPCPGGPWPELPEAPWLASKNVYGGPVTGAPGSISGDGRVMTFASGAHVLSTEPDRFGNDIFLVDLECDATTRVPVFPPANTNLSAYASALSHDGQVMAFSAIFSGGTNAIFVRDNSTGLLDQVGAVAPAMDLGGSSQLPRISGDGRFVTFLTDRALSPSDTNETTDIYLYDVQTKEIEGISVSSAGAFGDRASFDSAISFDGRYVVISTNALNFVPDASGHRIYLRDRETNSTTLVSPDVPGATSGRDGIADISDDGNAISFRSQRDGLVSDDQNGVDDFFVWRRGEAQVERVTIDSEGAWLGTRASWARLSGDGNRVLFVLRDYLDDTNPTQQVYLRDLDTGTTTYLGGQDASQAPGSSMYGADLDQTGQRILVGAEAVDLVDPPKPEPSYSAYLIGMP